MIRIVKLTFKPEYRQDFIDYIAIRKEKIIAYEGCNGVVFLNDISNPCIFFTYSQWDNEESLEKYRHSELFQTTWSKVKGWFDHKPEAWSVDSFLGN